MAWIGLEASNGLCPMCRQSEYFISISPCMDFMLIVSRIRMEGKEMIWIRFYLFPITLAFLDSLRYPLSFFPEQTMVISFLCSIAFPSDPFVRKGLIYRMNRQWKPGLGPEH